MPYSYGMKPRTAKRWLVVFLASMLVLNASVAWYLRKQIASGYGDFSIFYTAGKILADGQGRRLYDTGLQFEKQQAFARDVATRQTGALPYNHPPFEALVFWPLAKLGYFPAYCVWTAMNFAALLATLWLMRREVGWLHQAGIGVWLLVAVAYFPVSISLLQGQDTLWLLLCVVLAYGALRREAEFVAGCWLGVGLFRPQFVLPLVLLLAIEKRWRVLGGLAMVGAALGLISAAIVGWPALAHYPGFIFSVDQSAAGVTAPWGMPNLHGLVDTLGVGVGITGPWVAALTLILSAGVIVVASQAAPGRAGRGDGGPWFDLRFSLALVSAVLVSYHALEHDLTLLLLPCALVTNFVATSRLARQQRAALIAPILVLFFTPLYMWLSFMMRQTDLLALVLVAWGVGLWWELNRVNTRERVAVMT